MSFDQQIKEFGVVRIPGGASDSELAAAIAAEAATRAAADALVQTVLLGGTGASTAGAARTNLGAAAAADLAAAAAAVGAISSVANAAAADIALHEQYCVVGGSINAYTATPGTPWSSYVDGASLAVYCPSGSFNTAATTIDVSGLGAKAVWKRSQAGAVALTGGEFSFLVVLRYSTTLGAFEITSHFMLTSADIPSTLGATNFSGFICSVGSYIYNSSNTAMFQVQAGAAAGGSNLYLYPKLHATKPGWLEILCGDQATSRISLVDKNATEQFRVDEKGLTIGSSSGAGLIQGIWAASNVSYLTGVNAAGLCVSGVAKVMADSLGLRVPTAVTPASASATGTTGNIAWDANYIYVCTATNTWKRTAIATW